MCVVKIIIIILLLCFINDTQQNRQRLYNIRHKCKRISSMVGDKISSSKESDVMVYWFMRPTCPYCTKMQSAWDQVDVPNPYTKKTIDIGENPKMADEYGVRTVPHIVKQYPSGHVSVYEGDRSTQSLTKWIMNK